jgi:hypothetical protein
MPGALKFVKVIVAHSDKRSCVNDTLWKSAGKFQVERYPKRQGDQGQRGGALLVCNALQAIGGEPQWTTP